METADPSREDWAHGTAAAAAAGVTTIVEHTHGSPVRDADAARAKRHWAAHRSWVDFALAAHAWTDSVHTVEEAWDAGVAFFKVFTCTTHGVPGFDAARLRSLFREVARIGARCLVHCEDEALTSASEAELRAAGRSDGGVLPAWRTREAELVAVERVLAIAAAEGASVVIAHASHPRVLELVVAARAAGADVSAETCPQYLTLLEAEVEREGALRKFTPPARARSEADLDAMWAAVADGRVGHLSSGSRPLDARPETCRVHVGRPLRTARSGHDVRDPDRRGPDRSDRRSSGWSRCMRRLRPRATTCAPRAPWLRGWTLTSCWSTRARRGRSRPPPSAPGPAGHRTRAASCAARWWPRSCVGVRCMPTSGSTGDPAGRWVGRTP